MRSRKQQHPRNSGETAPMCMYVYTCVYLCVCLYTCVYVCLCGYVYTCVYLCVCVYVHVYMYICVYACCMCVMYVHTCVWWTWVQGKPSAPVLLAGFTLNQQASCWVPSIILWKKHRKVALASWQNFSFLVLFFFLSNLWYQHWSRQGLSHPLLAPPPFPHHGPRSLWFQEPSVLLSVQLVWLLPGPPGSACRPPSDGPKTPHSECFGERSRPCPLL